MDWVVFGVEWSAFRVLGVGAAFFESLRLGGFWISEL